MIFALLLLVIPDDVNSKFIIRLEIAEPLTKKCKTNNHKLKFIRFGLTIFIIFLTGMLTPAYTEICSTTWAIMHKDTNGVESLNKTSVRKDGSTKTLEAVLTSRTGR